MNIHTVAIPVVLNIIVHTDTNTTNTILYLTLYYYYLLYLVLSYTIRKNRKRENFYLKCKITLYTIYLPNFKTIHYVILFIFSNRRGLRKA